MRGENRRQATMLAIVSPEQRVPGDHPIRRIKALADAELVRLSPVLDAMYASVGRPSIPPERLLKACLLIALYSVRSERQFCERLQYDLLFRYFLDMDLMEDAFNASSFAKNKERLLRADVARQFFEGVVGQARDARLLSADHFTVDGTLIEAWASLKSFRPKDEDQSKRPPPDDPGNPDVDFRGEKRSNATHASTTDPEAKLARKGHTREAKLSYSAHTFMENRNGLCVDFRVAPATGRAELEQAIEMVRAERARGGQPKTVGADRNYDAREVHDALHAEGVVPHFTPYNAGNRRTHMDAETLASAAYAVSQRKRKRVEEIFGWMKTVGSWRKTRYRGLRRNQLWGWFVAAAYNLVRMAKLMPAVAPA